MRLLLPNQINSFLEIVAPKTASSFSFLFSGDLFFQDKDLGSKDSFQKDNIKVLFSTLVASLNEKPGRDPMEYLETLTKVAEKHGMLSPQ